MCDSKYFCVMLKLNRQLKWLILSAQRYHLIFVLSRKTVFNWYIRLKSRIGTKYIAEVNILEVTSVIYFDRRLEIKDFFCFYMLKTKKLNGNDDCDVLIHRLSLHLLTEFIPLSPILNYDRITITIISETANNSL